MVATFDAVLVALCPSVAKLGDPTGIRTPVIAVKGRCPRPLDDGDRGNFGGGGKRDRTADLLHAMQALSQLSYTPDEARYYSVKYLKHQLQVTTRILP